MPARRLATLLLVLSAVLSLSLLAAADTRRVYLPFLADPRPTTTAISTATATATATVTTLTTATSTATVTTLTTATSTATATTLTTATSTATATATTLAATTTSTATATATTLAATATSTATSTATATATVTSAADLAGRVALRPEYAYVTEVGGISTCTPRSDQLDGRPEFRDTILADQYQAFPGGPTYPTVGEVFLENEADQTFWRMPIYAGPAAELSYRKVDLPSGSYRLQAYIFYRHPLDPPGQGLRRYSLIWQGDGNPVDSLTVSIVAGQDVRLDLKLLLFGEVCAQRP